MPLMLFSGREYIAGERGPPRSKAPAATLVKTTSWKRLNYEIFYAMLIKPRKKKKEVETMKKMIALILAAVMLLSMAACGSGDVSKKAFEDSKEAFRLVTNAYLGTNEYSQDIYEAWRLGVNSRKDYDDEKNLSDFADEMHIEEIYIKQAIAKLLFKEEYEYGDWELLPYMFNGSYFSAWVSVISEAYVCSGDVAEISGQLNEAKNLMKRLGSDYADYEHYPVLKEYFTNTLAFFDFCQNPEGTFDQVVETFNAYRNNAREYFFDLNYVFCDSIGGMEDFVADNKENAEDANTEAAAAEE